MFCIAVVAVCRLW